MIVQIEIKDVYGTSKFYPVNSFAEAFAKIAGTKTLTHEVLHTITDMGFEVEVVTPKPDWKTV